MCIGAYGPLEPGVWAHKALSAVTDVRWTHCELGPLLHHLVAQDCGRDGPLLAALQRALWSLWPRGAAVLHRSIAAVKPGAGDGTRARRSEAVAARRRGSLLPPALTVRPRSARYGQRNRNKRCGHRSHTVSPGRRRHSQLIQNPRRRVWEINSSLGTDLLQITA